MSELDERNGVGERRERQRQFYASLFGRKGVQEQSSDAEVKEDGLKSREQTTLEKTQVNESTMNMSCSMLVEAKTELKHRLVGFGQDSVDGDLIRDLAEADVEERAKAWDYMAKKASTEGMTALAEQLINNQIEDSAVVLSEFASRVLLCKLEQSETSRELQPILVLLLQEQPAIAFEQLLCHLVSSESANNEANHEIIDLALEAVSSLDDFELRLLKPLWKALCTRDLEDEAQFSTIDSFAKTQLFTKDPESLELLAKLVSKAATTRDWNSNGKFGKLLHALTKILPESIGEGVKRNFVLAINGHKTLSGRVAMKELDKRTVL